MKLEINPKAKESIDANALILLGAVAPQRPMRGSTKTQRYTTEISRDAVQELTEYEFPAADCDDTIRAFYFSRAQQRFGVAGDEVRKLHVVLDALLKLKNVSSLLSRTYITDRITEWCARSFQQAEVKPLCDSLAKSAETDIRDFSVRIPIHDLEVAHSFSVGPVSIEPITQQQFEMLEQQWLGHAGDDAERIGIAKSHAHRLRKKFQGLACASVSVHAESRRALELAIARAEISVAFIRIFLPAAFNPSITSACAVNGYEHQGTSTAFLTADGATQVNSRTIGPSMAIPLDTQLLRTMKPDLDQIALLCTEEDLSDFDKTVRKAVLTFSKSTSTLDINDKLLYSISAMELLLNSTSQDAPIQQNVAERMAFLIQDAVERRRQVVDNFRTVYRLRSRYVHHGEVSSIDRAISEFYLNARTVIAIACKNIGRFPTKERFLYAVDNIKFGAKGVQSTVSTSGAAP